MLRFYKIVGAVLFIGSCFTECRPPERKQEPVPKVISGVYVTNEGNFQFGNSSVSYRDAQTGIVTSDIFFAANQVSLGDVCQSMINIGPYYYVVVNGSGIVEVVDTASFKSVKKITGCQSPRYIVPLSSTKAYITDLYDNEIHILNLMTNEISGHIAIPTWTEALLYANNKVYVSAPHSKYVLIVNPQSDQVVDTIETGEGVNSMVLDKYNTLWLLSDGDLGVRAPFIARVNITTDTIISQVQLDHSADRLACSGDKSVLYWLEQGVVRLPVDSSITQRTEIIPAGSHNWYGLGIHPFNEEVYVSDAFDYLQKSEVFIFNKEGIQQATFLAGIISGGFYFKSNGH